MKKQLHSSFEKDYEVEARQQIRKSNLGLNQAMGPVFLLTCIFFVLFLARQMAGPFLPAIEEELGISHAYSGLFILFMGIGFSLSQLGAAYMAGAWGYRPCILYSLWGSAFAMVLVGLLMSPWTLCFGFFVLGIVGGVYVPTGIAFITVLIRPSDWGKAMGIHEIAPNLGLIAAPFLATAAIYLCSWRLGYFSIAAASALLGVVYAGKGMDVEDKPSPPDLKRIRQTVSNRSFWVVGVLLSLAVGVETGVYAILPLFLVNERGFDLAAANQLLGCSRLPGLLMVLVSGWITDRLTPRITILLALCLSGVTIIFLGLGPRNMLIPAIFLQAAASACLFPPILSAASGISTPENRALTISLSLAVAPVAGGGLLPAGIALAGDLGSFSSGLAAAGIFALSGMVLIPFLKKKDS